MAEKTFRITIDIPDITGGDADSIAADSVGSVRDVR